MFRHHEASTTETGIDAYPIRRIEPPSGWGDMALGELWAARELIYFFVWRDIKVRYKQTVLGASWAILQPILTMAIFSLFFGRLAEMPSDDIPYPLFAFAALVPWTFFAAALTQASNSLVQSANMIKKTYFPRMAVPIASVLAGGVDFCLAFLVLLLMMFGFGYTPTVNILWLPLLIGLTILTSLGVGLWLSALNVLFRDVRYAIPFLVQAWFFATPITYPSSLLPERWRLLYGLNPMVGVIEGFRWALLGTDTRPGPVIMVSAVAALVVFVGGALYFQKMERSFADIV